MKRLIQKIEKKLHAESLVDNMSRLLSGSELNSFLLALFKKRVAQLTPTDVLQLARTNRFCDAAQIDPIAYKEVEISWLKQAEQIGFTAVQLSPVAPLGSSAAFGCVDQNNVVSALRGVEVVSDATNVLALKIADALRKTPVMVKQYCTTHQHVRSQYFDNPTFSAHFGLFCMVSGGREKNPAQFEQALVDKHLQFHCDQVVKYFEQNELSLDFYVTPTWKEQVKTTQQMISSRYPEIRIQVEDRDPANGYYEGIQFKIFLEEDGARINLSDGGLVNWTQQLLADKKQRLCISGAGLERIHKIERSRHNADPNTGF
ncbi:MAG: hypothetical protein AAF564_03665 [Bacteroidota bacterium]